MSSVNVQTNQASNRQTVTPVRAAAVSVVIPCFNESEGLSFLFEKLEFLSRELASDYQLEFVLVDDGSTDDTWEQLQLLTTNRADCRVVRHAKNQGIAAAVLTGIQNSQHDFIATIDADCSYDPVQLREMIPMLEKGNDVVTASPYHPQGKVLHVPAWRLALSRTASRMYRLLFRHKLHTYTSCFRVFRATAVRNLQIENPGFVGIAEMLWRLDRQGYRIAECPAELSIRQYGQSKLRVLSVACGHGRLLLQAASERLFRG